MATDSDADTDAAKTPVHLWIVGIVALLWNLIGVTDYVMTRTRNDDYFRSVMPSLDPQLIYAYIDSMPLLAAIGWGLGVWGALVGSLLLLARSRHAMLAYLVSLAGAVVSFAVQFTAPPPPAGMDDKLMPIVIMIIAVALFLYARAMKATGVLR